MRSKFELKIAIEGCNARLKRDEKNKQYWQGKIDGLLYALNEEYVPSNDVSLDCYLDEFKEELNEIKKKS